MRAVQPVPGGGGGAGNTGNSNPMASDRSSPKHRTWCGVKKAIFKVDRNSLNHLVSFDRGKSSRHVHYDGDKWHLSLSLGKSASHQLCGCLNAAHSSASRLLLPSSVTMLVHKRHGHVWPPQHDFNSMCICPRYACRLAHACTLSVLLVLGYLYPPTCRACPALTVLLLCSALLCSVVCFCVSRRSQGLHAKSFEEATLGHASTQGIERLCSDC